MYKIDLNSDLGEGAAFDAQIIPLITGANIACGFHAGSSEIMDKTIDLCKASGVAFGAHPGYPDRENFGRTKMTVTPKQVYDFTLYQLGALGAFAVAKGVKMQHVKPHGAMYNAAAKDPALAAAIADAIKDFDPIGQLGSNVFIVVFDCVEVYRRISSVPCHNIASARLTVLMPFSANALFSALTKSSAFSPSP